jgi:hypothetical protein
MLAADFVWPSLNITHHRINMIPIKASVLKMLLAPYFLVWRWCSFGVTRLYMQQYGKAMLCVGTSGTDSSIPEFPSLTFVHSFASFTPSSAAPPHAAYPNRVLFCTNRLPARPFCPTRTIYLSNTESQKRIGRILLDRNELDGSILSCSLKSFILLLPFELFQGKYIRNSDHF